MKAIGIDIGIKNICGILIDAKTGAVEKNITFSNNSFAHFQSHFRKTQEVVKIVDIVDKILECLPLDGVSAIGITGQMHGIVYLDKKGNLASSLYTWQDNSGDNRFFQP